MSSNNHKLDRIINNLCEGKNEEYKLFIRKMIYAMNEGDKWGKLFELKDLTDQLKNNN